MEVTQVPRDEVKLIQRSSETKEANKKPPVSFDDLTFVGENSMEEKKLLSSTPVRIVVAGNVDSGKSTLCGYLSKGIADDGNGSARSMVMNYPHERDTGRTSSVGQEIMGWNDKGVQQFAERFVQSKNKYWNEVVQKSSKFVTLVDLCGHEKYLKTTMMGMVGLVPDYAMIIIGANLGISKMTKEHLGISLALKIPFFIVVTKIDMVDKNVAEKTIEDIKKLLKTNAVNRKPKVIMEDSDVDLAAMAVATDKICPIFAVSSVTGHNMPRLVDFLYKVKSRGQQNNMIQGIDQPVEFDIHEKFNVTGIGLVVSGALRSGTMKVGQTLLCGPDKNKKFTPVAVKSLHVNRSPVEQAFAGNLVCCSIKAKKDEISRDDIRKGMCLIDPTLQPIPIWEFDAEIFVMQNATTIKVGYQAVLHCAGIMQQVTLTEMDKPAIMSKDQAKVKFKFMYHPEYLKKDSKIILREGRTKIIGMVTQVYLPVDQK